MSGGSFDYVQHTDVKVLLEDSAALESLVEQAKEFGFDAIAEKTQKVLNRLQAIRAELDILDTSFGNLQNSFSLRYAWKAMDFGFAGDWTFGDIEWANEKQK